MKKKTDPSRIVALTGAGISAESGLRTFRDGDGLWEGHRIEDVATPEAWNRDPEQVLRFYNERRKQVIEAVPNRAHHALAELETAYEVDIITQNVDDLHERAGSSRVIHLHGEVRKSQSSISPDLVYPIHGDKLLMGELCELGAQLRPFIVWFGEAVPLFDRAVELTMRADLFLVVGTSLLVYPAASLLQYVTPGARTVIVDRKLPQRHWDEAAEFKDAVEFIEAPASVGVPKLVAELLHAVEVS